jgi:hypothetical protein
MLKPGALLALLCILAACSPDSNEAPQTTGTGGVESEPSGPSTAVPAAQNPTPTSPDTTAAMTPADSNTTLPAATLEEAAPPPEP